MEKHVVFVFLRASVIAEGDDDEGIFSERACFLQISIQFSAPSILCHACRVSCASRLSQIISRRRFFAATGTIFFGRYFIFENATQLIFSQTCVFDL